MAFDLQDASRGQDEVSITASLNGEVPNEPGAAHLSQLVVKLRRKNSEGDPVDLLELDVHCRLAKSANRHEHRLNETAPYDQHFKGKLIDHGSQKTTMIPAAYVTGAIPRRLGIRRKLSLVLAEQWAMNLLERPGRFKEPSGAPVHDKGGGRLDALAERAAEEIIRRLEANETPRRLSPRLRPEHSVAVADVQYLVPKIAKALPYDEYVIDGLRTKQASELTRAAEFLGSYMSDHVRYLGPLRFEPQAVMPMSPNPSGGDIGPKGEYTASVLRLLGPKIVRCPLPGVRGYAHLPLQEAVRNWLSYLDVAEDVQVIDVPQLGHTIRVLPLGLNRAVSLTHVGVGVSQILPVLVLCLLAEPETLILLEQPELHLHPATQQLLGEFLLAVSASGRQLIIETHSEHLVRRLLRSIAEDKTDRARELVGFVSSVRDRESATTVYEPIQPNPYGGFDTWPHGFFDQGPEEARQTLRAAMEKRSAEKAN
jgi:predicted ATPase